MAFINVKNDTEKLEAIRSYCHSQLKNIEYNISFLEGNKDGPLDYRDEIHDLEITKKRFLTLLEIVNAGPTENIFIQ